MTPETKESIGKETGEFKWGHHVVCILDLLGQEAKLFKLGKQKPDLNPSSDFLKLLKGTCGTILWFRENFESYFAAASQETLPQALIDSLPEEGKSLYRRCKDYRLGLQQFGDTFVFFSPLGNESGDISMVPIYQMILACSWAMILSLAAKVPMRGALCVGQGTEISTNTLCGPVLAEAHVLEATAAGYPRVILSPSAAGLVGQKGGFSKDPSVEKIMAAEAKRCRSLICQESDGFMTVDYLAEGFRSFKAPKSENFTAAVEKAYRFVRSEAGGFWHKKDYKLAPRYTRLQNYFEARLPIWDLGYLKEAE